MNLYFLSLIEKKNRRESLRLVSETGKWYVLPNGKMESQYTMYGFRTFLKNDILILDLNPLMGYILFQRLEIKINYGYDYYTDKCILKVNTKTAPFKIIYSRDEPYFIPSLLEPYFRYERGRNRILRHFCSH